MAKLLDGLVVLDFTRALAGPFCTMVLADLGARVIKLEVPEAGDGARENGPFVNGRSTYFTSINRGKESITIDLRHPKGRELAEELAAKADVVVENFRPGVMERLGLDYSRLSGINPRLVYLSLSGFGQTGPAASQGAFDIVIQAMSGVMSINGVEGGAPTRVGISIGDILPALYGTTGILAGLNRRALSGKGCYLDIAMLDCLIGAAENAVARHWATGVAPKPLGNRHPVITPFDAYPTADGQIVFAVGGDAQWRRLCEALDLEELAQDPAYATNDLRTQNVEALTHALSTRLRTTPTRQWLARLQKGGVPCGPVNTIADIVEDPQVRHRRMMIEIDQPGMGLQRMPGVPIKAWGYDDSVSLPAPDLGEHTEALLQELLGLSQQEIDVLILERVV